MSPWGWPSSPRTTPESEVAANAVVVTRVLNTDDVFGYSLSVQDGNNLVTNPDPGTHSEVTIAAFICGRRADQPDRHPVRASRRPRDQSGQSRCCRRSGMLELVDLAKAVEQAYCRAKPGFHPDCASSPSANDKDAALDLEVKILANGRLVYKQVREFGGR